MTTALVLLALAAAAGVAVFALSARAPTEPLETPEIPAPALETGRTGSVTGPVPGVALIEPASQTAVPAPRSGDRVPGAFSYLPERMRPGSRPLGWRTRLVGFVGLVVLVPIAGLALAAGLWVLGHLLGRLLAGLFTP